MNLIFGRKYGYHKRFYQRADRRTSDPLFDADPGGVVSAGALRRGGSAGGRKIRGNGRRLRRSRRLADHDDRHRAHQLPCYGKHDSAWSEAGDERGEGLRKCDRRECRLFWACGICPDAAAPGSFRSPGKTYECAAGGFPGDAAVHRRMRRREPCHCRLQCAGQCDAGTG